MENSSSAICPTCKQIDQVQSIKTIYTSGTSTIEYAPPGSLIGTSTANLKTTLAQRIAPPHEPDEPKFGDGKRAFILSFGLVVGYFLGLFFDNYFLKFAVIVGSTILIFRFFYSRAKSAVEKYKQVYPVWLKASNRWSKLYYCIRDDCVFDPETGEQVSPEGLSKLLYR